AAPANVRRGRDARGAARQGAGRADPSRRTAQWTGEATDPSRGPIPARSSVARLTARSSRARRRRERGGYAGRVGRDRKLVVALDGPASSGKSSVGAAAALQLGYRFCDTGLIYRAATWLALERHVQPDDPNAIVALVPEIQLVADANGRLAQVSVDGVDVT